MDSIWSLPAKWLYTAANFSDYLFYYNLLFTGTAGIPMFLNELLILINKKRKQFLCIYANFETV